MPHLYFFIPCICRSEASNFKVILEVYSLFNERSQLVMNLKRLFLLRWVSEVPKRSSSLKRVFIVNQFVKRDWLVEVVSNRRSPRLLESI